MFLEHFLEGNKNTVCLLSPCSFLLQYKSERRSSAKADSFYSHSALHAVLTFWSEDYTVLK